MQWLRRLVSGINPISQRRFYNWLFITMSVYTLSVTFISCLLINYAVRSTSGNWVLLTEGNSMDLWMFCNQFHQCRRHGFRWGHELAGLLKATQMVLMIGILFLAFYIYDPRSNTLHCTMLYYYCAVGNLMFTRFYAFASVPETNDAIGSGRALTKLVWCRNALTVTLAFLVLLQVIEHWTFSKEFKVIQRKESTTTRKSGARLRQKKKRKSTIVVTASKLKAQKHRTEAKSSND